MTYHIHFIRDSKMRPMACVAFSDKISADTQQLEYGISVLHPKDQFNRKIARQLAIGRLIESPKKIAVQLFADNVKLNLNHLIDEILNDVYLSRADMPKRLRVRAAEILHTPLELTTY